MKAITLVAAATAPMLYAASAMPTAAQSYPLECAQRDVQVVIQIEEVGEAQSAAGEILYEAFKTLLRARTACSEGRVTLGLALYDSIFTTSLAGHLRAR